MSEIRVKRASRTYNETRRQGEEHLPSYREPDYGVRAEDFVPEDTRDSFANVLEKIAEQDK